MSVQAVSERVPVEESDADLASRVAAGPPGDGEALRALHGRYAERLYGVAYRILRDAGEAQDVLQETWIRLCRHAGRYDPSRSLSAWLLRIAGNLARNRRRWLRVRRWVALPTTPAEEPADARSPLGDAEASDDRGRLREALECLRPRQRDALLLHYSEGMSIEDVAQALGIPVGTVKTEMHRGRMKLRSLLGGSPEGESP